MSELTEIGKKIDAVATQVNDIKLKVSSLDQGINGGDGAVGLASQVKDHGKFIRENRPMIVIGRMATYTGIGSVVTVVVMYVLKDMILKFMGGG